MKFAFALGLLSLAVTSAYAANVSPATVPTLDEGGLVALIALVGVVGGFVARRRKK
jgi:hypothetical protein